MSFAGSVRNSREPFGVHIKSKPVVLLTDILVKGMQSTFPWQMCGLLQKQDLTLCHDHGSFKSRESLQCFGVFAANGKPVSMPRPLLRIYASPNNVCRSS